MAQLLIRNIDDELKARLHDRARRHGRSTEAEIREILRNAVRDEAQPSEPLGKRLRALFRGIGIDEDIPECRGHPANPAELP